MNFFDPPYAFWSIWRSLSWAQRGFFLILFAVSGYCIFSLTKVLLRLRSTSLTRDCDSSLIYSRIAHLRQMIGATFYLFGFVLFFSLQFAINTFGDGRGSLWLQIQIGRASCRERV